MIKIWTGFEIWGKLHDLDSSSDDFVSVSRSFGRTNFISFDAVLSLVQKYGELEVQNSDPCDGVCADYPDTLFFKLEQELRSFTQHRKG